MRVPIYERKGSIDPLRGGEVNAVTPAGDYGAEAAKTANAFLLKFQQIQDDTEDARTLELLNKFKADSNNYHENPDSGAYNTRLGINAQGFYSEADQWLRERGEKYVQGLKSERAKKNFRDKALEYINQKGIQNSRFEADQVKKYQTEQATATYQNGLNEIGLNPYDDDFVNSTKQNMTDALELMLRYASPEKRKEALAGLENDVASARFDAIYQQDTDAAEKFYQANKGLFTADTLQKAEKKLERSRIQRIVDVLAEKFPDGNEQEALKYIRENFSGEREENIASAYKTRINENTIKEANAERALRKDQTQYKNEIIARLIGAGVMPSEEELINAVNNQRLNHTDFLEITNWRDRFANRAWVEKRVRAEFPDLTQEDTEIEVMRRMGVTQQDRATAIEDCIMQIAAGADPTKTTNFYYSHGLFSAKDAATLKNGVKTLNDVRRDTLDRQKAAMTTMLNSLVNDGLISVGEKQEALTAFTTEAAITLNDITDLEYPKKVQDIRQKILIDMLDSLNKAASGGWFSNGNESVKEKLKATQDEEDLPPFPFDWAFDYNIPLPSDKSPARTSTGARRKISSKIADYETEINSAAESYGVEPELIKAVIQQESGGNPNATSKANAKGLMQLIDSTATRMGVIHKTYQRVYNIYKT